jgi:phosphoglycolate phosphatase
MKVVIFDMDGTLIDSQHDITLSINHVRKMHHSLDPLQTREVVAAINGYQRNLAELFYGTEVYLEEDRRLFEMHYHEQCVQNPTLYEGVSGLLAMLREAGVKCSVATNAPSRFARRMLEHLQVMEHFDHVFGADMVEHPKPDREMLRAILGRYGYDDRNDRAWMVGDNAKDMQAARSANIEGIFAAWGFSREGEGDHVAAAPIRVMEIVFGKRE